MFTDIGVAIVLLLQLCAIWFLSLNVQKLEDRLEKLENSRYAIKVDEEGYNPAIDPTPETAEERDWLIRQYKEGDM